MQYYRGKRVIVTGGSAGIGRATAVRLASAGAHVVVAARGQSRLDETVQAMREANGSVTVGSVSVDVTDPSAVEAAIADGVAQLGGLDILVCNSGYAHTGPVHEVPADDFTSLLNVNYLGHVHTVRSAVPHLIESKGDICLVSSMLGFMSLWGYGAYSASKYAITGFAEALRQEMTLHDVRVTLFYPPTTKTPGLEKENEDKHPMLWALESESGWNKVYTADEVASGLLKAIPSRRFHTCVGLDSWILYTAARYLPGFTRWMSDIELRKAARKVSERSAAS